MPLPPMRRAVSACLVGVAVAAAACGDAPALADNEAYIAGARVTVTPIPAPDSEMIWAQDVVSCLGVGDYPAGVRWQVAKLPDTFGPIIAWTDYALHTITVDSSLLDQKQFVWRRVARHEIVHMAVGWKANHPVAPPVNVVNVSEPARYFNARCQTL